MAARARRVRPRAKAKVVEPVIFGVPVPYSERGGLPGHSALVPLGESLVIENQGGYVTISLGSQHVFCSMMRHPQALSLAQTCQIAESHLKALRTALNKLTRKR